MPHYVYRIKDKKTGIIGYVGVTSNPDNRMQQHLHDKRRNKKKYMWLKSIDPEMEIIEQLDNRSDALERERYWIRYYKSLNVYLTNIAHIQTTPSRVASDPVIAPRIVRKCPIEQYPRPVPPYYPRYKRPDVQKVRDLIRETYNKDDQKDKDIRERSHHLVFAIQISESAYGGFDYRGYRAAMEYMLPLLSEDYRQPLQTGFEKYLHDYPHLS
jgi:predicted GIY-YIG superfamily endonuclease